MSFKVHLDWRRHSHLVGTLYPADKGEVVSFQYASEWLSRENAFAIDPTSLPLQEGAIHSRSLFGVLTDCGPDRWGKLLIQRAVQKKVLPKQPYREIDYVLALDDTSRIGALRFRAGADQPFLASTRGKLPPIIELPALIRAADAINGDSETAKDLRYLLGQGSPLGGARPKSAVRLEDGNLGIAKFPKPDDIRDIAAGEVLALTLARATGIRTADHQLIFVEGRGVAVISRFDRAAEERIHFISAASLLGLPPGENGTYTGIADAIRQFGDDVAGDLRELWRRMVFSLLASNYDDHPRNHGFLMRQPGRWALSPAYDLNPVPEIDRARINKTAISEDHPEPSVAGALETAARFGLRPDEARSILRDMVTVVSDWHKTGRKLRIKAGILDAYESAFDHELMQEARALM